MARWTNLKSCWRRCLHFTGHTPRNPSRYWLDRDLPIYLDHGCTAEGAGIIAHNYAAMQSIADTLLERLYWLDAVASALNRYADTHQVKSDLNYRRCISWWARQVFFDPEKL